MAEARCYECSACGGLVRELARVCNYCRSPVATVRCARCFMMNVPEALHCVSCGTELGLMPVPSDAEHEFDCPRCQSVRLDGYHNGEATLYDCESCGGQFVTNSDLTAMLQAHECRLVEAPRLLRKENPLSQPVTYVPCPKCQQLMLRRNFGGISGVVVDVCAAHGTWFDAGELPRILAFVGSGGLRLVRQREAERQSRRATNVERSFVVARSVDTPYPTVADAYDQFETAVRSFVRWVLSNRI